MLLCWMLLLLICAILGAIQSLFHGVVRHHWRPWGNLWMSVSCVVMLFCIFVSLYIRLLIFQLRQLMASTFHNLFVTQEPVVHTMTSWIEEYCCPRSYLIRDLSRTDCCHHCGNFTVVLRTGRSLQCHHFTDNIGLVSYVVTYHCLSLILRLPPDCLEPHDGCRIRCRNCLPFRSTWVHSWFLWSSCWFCF